MTNNVFDLFKVFEEDNVNKKEVTVQHEETNTTGQTVNAPAETVEAVENDFIDPAVTDDTKGSDKVTEDTIETVELGKEEGETDSENAFEALSKQADAADAEINEKAEKGEKAKGAKDTANKKSEPAEEEFKLNELTVIRYYREEIPVTDYFTTTEIAEGLEIKKKDNTIERKAIDGEIVRSRLEKDFPEFVKGYTEMKYFGKDKNFILPVVIAKKKGNVEVSCL